MAGKILIVSAINFIIQSDALNNARFANGIAFKMSQTQSDYEDSSPQISDDVASANTYKFKYASSTNNGLLQGYFDVKRSFNQQTSSMYEGVRKRWRRFSQSRMVINQHFSERTLAPGGDVSLQCAAIADRPPQFTWHRDGLPISSSTDSRYALGQMMRPDGTVLAQLNISRLRVEDGGLYSCTANEGDQMAVHENRIDVYGPPYIRALPPIKVQSGESLNLRCPYYGYPISKIDWEHKGKVITSNNLFPNRYRRSQHRRTIRSAMPRKRNSELERLLRSNENSRIIEGDLLKNDENIHIEENKSQIHKNERRNRVIRSVANIHGILTIPEVTKALNGAKYTCTVTSPSGEMARRDFDIKVIEAPVLDDLLLGNNLQEGQVANIYCNVRTGDLPIHFEWLKDGKRIPSNLKVVERSAELFSALVIKSVALEHCGTYTCVATNHVATVNKSTELYIKVAPKWLLEPTNSSVVLGKRGVVSCSATGYPTPQVHWMKKDAILGTWQPVLELAGGGILSLANGSLVIEDVSPADEGMYSCNIENGVGTPLTKTIWITVNKPVHFVTSSPNVTSRAGLPLSLECNARGDEPIKIIWTHNGNNIDFRNHRLKLSEVKSPSAVTSTIKINFAESHDGGVYQCKATNPYGMASYDLYIHILEPPTPPTELRVETISSRSATVSWRGTSQHYTLQHAPATVPSWDGADTVNVTSKTTDLRQVFKLQNLRPSTSYSIRVAAVNQVAVSHYTEPLHFTTEEEAPSSAPQQIRISQTEEPGELFLSWSPPDTQTHNGRITGYHIKAVPQNTGTDEPEMRTIKVSSQVGKQETILRNLLKNTRYAVSVAAYNSAGTGPYSLPVFQETKAGAPENAPSSVECTAVSPTSLRVGWQPLHKTAELLGYTVLYASEDSTWQNTTALHTELYLQNLMKYTNYTIKVAGYSSYGAGPFSYPIVCSTLEDVPGSPAEIKVLVLSPSSLLVSWKPPEQPNGEITYYTVYAKPVGLSGGVTLTQRIDANRSTAEIKDLTVSRTYEVWVCASTRAGEGRPSKRVSQTPTQRVVAGVSSLGGTISIGAGSSLLLKCECVGSPAARTVWYHNHNIITHHPRFTRNHDDSLLINNIDQSLSGNYTCLAKNLYGSDSVEYTVVVLPLPEPPVLRATPYKDSILIEWEQSYYNNRSAWQKISYSLTWKEANGPWQESWSPDELPDLSDKISNKNGVQKYLLTGLKCGTKYSIRITASSKVGTSQPAYMETSTLGGVPIPPSSNEWLWSNSSHMLVQAAGWEDGGCDLSSWDLEYRPLGSNTWIRARNKMIYSDTSWPLYQASYRTSSFAISDLNPATWYQVRVTAANEAGSVTSVYTFATKNLDGSEVGPLSEVFDLNMLVIVLSSILLVVCLVCCVYILLVRQRTTNFIEYRDSITIDNKSESGNLTNTSHSNLAAAKENALNSQNRIYSTPIPVRNNSKHELYEISPYAQFAVGFRTFGHVDNQDIPNAHRKHRYDSETSFQMCSESEDSDTISKNTLKSIPRSKCSKELCRTPHYR